MYYVSDQFARGLEVRMAARKPFYLTADEGRWKEGEGNLNNFIGLNCVQATRRESIPPKKGKISVHTKPSSVHTYLKVSLAEFIGSGCQVSP